MLKGCWLFEFAYGRMHVGPTLTESTPY